MPTLYLAFGMSELLRMQYDSTFSEPQRHNDTGKNPMKKLKVNNVKKTPDQTYKEEQNQSSNSYKISKIAKITV